MRHEQGGPMSPSSLLNKLLDYVLEQDKEIDPRGFKLQSYKGFLKGRPDLQGLPGVDFDIKLDGDHIWMRVARLEAKAPPALPAEQWKGVIVVSDNPEGARRGLTRLRSRAAFWRKARPSPRTSSPWLKLNGGRRPNKFWRSTRPCGRPGRRARFRAVRRFPSTATYSPSSINWNPKRPPSHTSWFGVLALLPGSSIMRSVPAVPEWTSSTRS